MAHRWHIVLNNPNFQEDLIIDTVYNERSEWWTENRIKFIFYKKHLFQKNKTPHYHIYIEFSIRRSFKFVREKIGFSRAHIEKCYKDRRSNILYIENEDKVLHDETGKPFNIVSFLD